MCAYECIVVFSRWIGFESLQQQSVWFQPDVTHICQWNTDGANGVYCS